MTAAVVDLLCRRGLQAMDLDMVAGLARVSGSWLRGYFADAEALVAEVVRDQIRDVFAKPGLQLITAAAPGDLYRWRDGVVAAYRATRMSAGYPLGIVVHELTGRDGRASEALAASLGPWQSALSDAFARLRDRGELAPGSRPMELAIAVMGALVGAMGRSGKACGPDDVLEPFDMMLRHVLTARR
ncbi:TetR/AcrR family transcriptional regulator [Amycolatopsis sp. NPDC051903]|uniref:TetR/AcrR family transcriptional regulator n=1 Tax=Amycolatopsis sp. NPDC051903 TaxID=3363936 RepID=UPI0037A6C104